MLILACFLILVSTFLALEYSSASARQVKAQLKRANSYAVVDHRQKELSRSATERLLAPMFRRFAEFAMRLSPQASRMMLARKLQAAGSNAPPNTFLAVKGGLTLGGVVIGLFGAVIGHQLAILMIGIMIS